MLKKLLVVMVLTILLMAVVICLGIFILPLAAQTGSERNTAGSTDNVSQAADDPWWWQTYDNGDNSNLKKKILRGPAPTIVTVTATPSPAAVGTGVTFSGSAQDRDIEKTWKEKADGTKHNIEKKEVSGTITGKYWYLGTERIGSGATINHTFPEPGVYTVTFKVTANHTDHEESASDGVEVTILEVEKVRLSSGNAIESPIDFEGGRFELGDPCRRTNAEPSLIIPHYRVRSVSDPSIIRDFVVGADAFLLPGGMELPEDLQNINKWSKVAGPDSGNFKNLKDLDNQYQNPKKGGVYELQFELLGSKTKALLHLPLAGGDSSNWIETQRVEMANMVNIIHQLPLGLRLFAIYHVSYGCDWHGSAIPSGCAAMGGRKAHETITIHNVVVDRPKLQNLMWGYFIYYYVDEWGDLGWAAAKFFADLAATPDTPPCSNSCLQRWQGLAYAIAFKHI